MKIEIDMDAVCVKCGRKGATTSLTFSDEQKIKLPVPICLDCALEELKKNGMQKTSNV